MSTAVLPNLDHFRMADAEKVYEPAEDTFLLCDAICQEREFLCYMKPRYVLEIGAGSGCVITYTSQLLRDNGIRAISMATDINPDALLVTQRTASYNDVCMNIRHCVLKQNFVCFMKLLLLFENPGRC